MKKTVKALTALFSPTQPISSKHWIWSLFSWPLNCPTTYTEHWFHYIREKAFTKVANTTNSNGYFLVFIFHGLSIQFVFVNHVFFFKQFSFLGFCEHYSFSFPPTSLTWNGLYLVAEFWSDSKLGPQPSSLLSLYFLSRHF